MVKHTYIQRKYSWRNIFQLCTRICDRESISLIVTAYAIFWHDSSAFYREINRWVRATGEMGPSECLGSVSETSLLMWL